jgi:hypothetical protein
VEPQVTVLAAGGVFLDQNGALHGSDYASGYTVPGGREQQLHP